MEKSLTASYDPQRPVALPKTLGILRRGLGDPTIRLSQTEAWLAFATPLGDATLHIHKPSPSSPAALQAWGPGAQWAMESAPNLLGAKDDWTDFDAGVKEGKFPEIIARSRFEHPDFVLPSTGRIFEHVTGAILEQRVTGIEANYAWRWLIRHLGHRAPGPAPEGLMIFPGPQKLATMKRWDWQAARVEGQRATTMARVVRVASSLQWWADKPINQPKPKAMAPGTLEAALASVSGVGPWTIAETLQRSHGSADHISVGDFHLADFVGQVLAGSRISDAQMLDLLAPYAPHRQRVVRLLQLSGQRKQSFGPRYAPLDHRRR
ncbi:DNA-3-methyladenine glycosylase family protein [Glutamicibacter nicotianae]|uniref:3-methyladenine DNA glycosylase n=1 Tax=Glutamicibacter nicotianae TaxID=37929 RepID=A0ABQ0RJ32_GLUNI|nr:3-methyladenine DNA glycosylase [Glutamicibacter nicotianae]GEC11817.1 3-methyladenine DNA glycosylase [Glutamicibacter nicotianae]